MAVRVVLVVCLLLVFAIAGVGAEEQKTTVSFEYYCNDSGGDWSNLSCHFSFRLKGTINNAMLEKFRLAIAEVPTSREVHRSVYIDSLGGDVRAAMEIGRIVRRREMGVNVIPETSCASACVLVFAAGVDRDIYESPGKAVTFAMLYPAKTRPSLPSGAIGIHRVYIGETPQQPVTLAEVKQRTDQTVAALRSYLQEMNVSVRVADDMMAVPPQNIRWLTASEQEDYGLIAIDPVWQETQDLNEARKLGISPVEYMKRKENASRICYGASGAPAGCYDRVLRTGR